MKKFIVLLYIIGITISVNAQNHTLKDYVDAMKDVCERYSIPVIDLFNTSGLNPSLQAVKDAYMPDGLHPNAVGHKMIANIMSYWLNLYATAEPQKEVVETEKGLRAVNIKTID